jgi:DNA polymerase III epsilon subunit-like protein
VGARRFSLDGLAEHLDLLPRPRHRALGDADLAADLFQEILRQAAARRVTSLEALQSLQSAPSRPAPGGSPGTGVGEPPIRSASTVPRR